MRSRGVSKAFQELDTALKERGYDIPSTRIESWCYWGTKGLVDRPTRRGAGRGTTSSFPDLARAADQTIAVEGTLRPRDSLDLAALRLSASGHDLDGEDVKAAFLRVLDALERKFMRDARATESDDPIELASNLGWAAHRTFTRGGRARARRAAGFDSLPDGWIAAGRVLRGDPVTHDDVQNLMSAMGLSHFATALGDTLSDIVDAITPSLSLFSFGAIRDAVTSAQGDDIVVALRGAQDIERRLTRLSPALADAYAMDSMRLGAAVVLLRFPKPNFGGDDRAT